MRAEICTLPCFETKKRNTLIRTRLNDVIATAIPQMDGDRVVRVIETDQNINEFQELNVTINEEIELNEKYKKELEYFRNQEVSISIGESGVGKEIIAKFIYKNSLRNDKPFIKLNVVPLNIPPLRERTADIMPLASHFIDKLNEKYHKYKHINYTCAPILSGYSWPGNVRQLENLMERVYISTDAIHLTAAHLEPYLTEEMPADLAGTSLKDIVGEFEKKYIEKIMGNYSSSQELANALKIDKSTLLRKIARYGIKNIYLM